MGRNNSLTVKQLALYLGCDCMVYGKHKTKILAVHTNGNVQIAHPMGRQDMVEAEYVKPILRPLNTITEQEAHEYLQAIYFPIGMEILLLNVEHTGGATGGITFKRRTAHSQTSRWSKRSLYFWQLAGQSRGIPFLLSNYFDCFGWIDLKLAKAKK